MTIKELQKERLTIRKTDPVRASVLATIIDSAKKIAKEDNREATEADITLAAKRFNKSLNKVVTDVMKEMGVRRNDPILSEYLEEIKVTESFLPKMLNEAQTAKVISEIIFGLSDNEKNIGNIMKIVKRDYSDSIDGKIASGIIKKML